MTDMKWLLLLERALVLESQALGQASVSEPHFLICKSGPPVSQMMEVSDVSAWNY